MNQVIERKSGQEIVASQPEAQSVMELVMRAVKDPECDPAKMMQLLELSRQIRADEAAQAYSIAMVAAQKEMDPVRTNAANKQTSSRYATYDALNNAIRPIYSKHGFAVSWDTGGDGPMDHVRVLANVMHESGHTKVYHFDIPADGKGAKGGDVQTKTHAAGSAFKYGRRYLLGGIFDIVIWDGTDDDGNAAGGSGLITADQMEDLKLVIDRTGSDPEKVCKHFSLESMSQITKKQLPRIIEALNSQPRKKA